MMRGVCAGVQRRPEDPAGPPTVGLGVGHRQIHMTPVYMYVFPPRTVPYMARFVMSEMRCE